MALGFAVGARGADHNRSGAYEVDFSDKVDRRHATVDSVRHAIDTEDRAALMDSLILCKFLRGVFTDFYAESANCSRPSPAGTSPRVSSATTARRIIAGKREFNLRAGWTPQEDTLPERFLNRPLPDDPAAVLTAEGLRELVTEYHRQRGWGDGRMSVRLLIAGITSVFALVCLTAPVHTQRSGAFMGSSDDSAIQYSTATPNNVVVDVNRRLQNGELQFAYDGRSGYLQSALAALQLPIDSQLLVFSRTSLQGRRIGEQNPRALYFNDRVALGWVRGGDLLEVAAHDQTNGIVFYSLEQKAPETASAAPQFKREFICLGCHMTGNTLNVPGLLMFSTTRAEPTQFSGIPRHIDQTDSLNKRFGGWFVTGSAGSVAHMGNQAAALDARPTREIATVDGLFDAEGYRTLSSDIVAHLVLTHQAGMINLLTRAGWEARAADPKAARAVYQLARAGRAHCRGHGRHCQRGRRLSAVRGRSEVDRQRAWYLRLCGALLSQWPEGSQGALAL
jgi:hypothetical protein